jgi:dTDP-3-amino-3,4,6-trideoxy-alpha-D-glucose transaminase
MSEAKPLRPFHDLAASFAAQRDEILEACRRVLDGGWYILGPEVQRFEAEFASFAGATVCVGTGSATESLHIGLLALGVRPGDEVVVPALTAAPTAMAVIAAGARPVFCDVDPQTFLLDPRALERLLGARTRVVIPVDLYGQVADYSAIESVIAGRDIAVLEDASQAHGARDGERRAGTFGRLAAFSFYPTKNLGAYGDGGCVTTNESELGERVRRLRNYGFIDDYDCVQPGINARLDELHAAMLRVKLGALAGGNERRRRHAARYEHEIRSNAITLPHVRAGAHHVYHQFVVRSGERDRLRAYLRQRGIETLIHYPRALSDMQAFTSSVDPALRPRAAERAAHEILSLPIYPEMTADHQDEVIAAVNDFR